MSDNNCSSIISTSRNYETQQKRRLLQSARVGLSNNIPPTYQKTKDAETFNLTRNIKSSERRAHFEDDL